MKKLIIFGIVLLMSGCIENAVISECPNGYHAKKEMALLKSVRSYSLTCENTTTGHDGVVIFSNTGPFDSMLDVEGYNKTGDNETVTAIDCDDYSCYLDIKKI